MRATSSTPVGRGVIRILLLLAVVGVAIPRLSPHDHPYAWEVQALPPSISSSPNLRLSSRLMWNEGQPK